MNVHSVFKSQSQGELCVFKERPAQSSQIGTTALVMQLDPQECSLKASLGYTSRHPSPQKSSALLNSFSTMRRKQHPESSLHPRVGLRIIHESGAGIELGLG